MSKMREQFSCSNEGSVTIEFTVVFVLFLLTLLSCAEISRLLYISASLDLAVSEAVKSTKNREDSNSAILRQSLTAQNGILGAFITNNNAINTTVEFSNNISDLINQIYSGSETSPLAKYTVTYIYHPLFFPIPSHWANIQLSREVIFVQENQ
ncbi:MULTISPECIES: TadE/TadG family type IV pilus assembly protein [unclassified Yersinia (in: enterobacteria)]|uniref:TadE/TadG family type IV pilus assembly protein n=2 Tax=Yersinia TaxID=629 RepID=UPI003B281CB5